MSLNKVMLIGNVGKDPQIKKTQIGKNIATFSLATTESWKNKTTGEYDKKTEWHNIVILAEGLAGIVEKAVHKGSRLYIEGTLRNRQYESKDGLTKYVTEVVLQGYNNKLVILTPRDETPTSGDDTEDYNHIDDDIPF